jgi:hypothetical protein
MKRVVTQVPCLSSNRSNAQGHITDDILFRLTQGQKRADGFGTDGSWDSGAATIFSMPALVAMDTSRLRIGAVMQSEIFVHTPTTKLMAVIIQASTDQVRSPVAFICRLRLRL